MGLQLWLLGELLCVVGCCQSLVVVFGDVLLLRLGGAYCSFDFVLLLLIGMWAV